ncbi:N-acetyltransferase [Streptococcus chenjunshii]|uniref:N-acetyltransferase n=1 Tax=Streptococcus chenjunshii TaxID=2173853 RepID=A0A372KPE9_9STRE|nr:GNAT family N-acetyltransferase [Streptococcus chenjunshii]AXQ78595.1 N-acetyltransferase [Streptococcus chenjunshii]RFU51941.1 N-acetyltransferase [Streptococcus chenjunshii]RFU54133.1 N-acetyltransferase [Streptococcus chenjunshii]
MYKNILMNHLQKKQVSERYIYYGRPDLALRYDNNIWDYHLMPDREMFEADLSFIAQEQKDYPLDYANIAFPEKTELPVSWQTQLQADGFELERLLIFTAPAVSLNLSHSAASADIKIEQLSETTYQAYMDKHAEEYRQYGDAYYQQMTLFNQELINVPDGKLFLAVKNGQIVGELTVWYSQYFAEIDNFMVDESLRGQGIGKRLQEEAIKTADSVILIAAEENRAMYEYQGYQETAFYWTAFKSEDNKVKTA